MVKPDRDPEKVSFGMLLKELREKALGLDDRGRPRMTQFELARRSGIREKSIQRWETGENLPSATDFLKLLEAMGVTLDQVKPLIGANAHAAEVSEQAPTGAGLDELADAKAPRRKPAPKRQAQRRAS